MKKTKVVATLGPSTKEQEIINQMALSGVDVFRINLSHANFLECDDYIKKIKKAEKASKRILGIMLDIDGPSIRLDKLKEEEVCLETNATIRFYNYHVLCNNTQLSTNYDNIVELVSLNDIILLSNGKVKLEVKEVNKDNFVCNILEGGIIRSNQTVHIRNAKVNLPFISKKDKENILYAIKNNVDYLALSFVRDEQDVLSVVDMLIENGNETISLISKIETESGFQNIDEILKVSDGIMIGRGDLGLNIPLERNRPKFT